VRRADHSPRGVLLSVMCITECDSEASLMRMPRPTGGCCTMVKKRKSVALRTEAGAVWTVCATAGLSVLPQL
jgi:hypothetical protein